MQNRSWIFGALFTYKQNTKHLKGVRYVTLVQTFLLLGAAEAAGGLLELITVNFDHPKRAEHLCQVGGFVTEERSDFNTFSSTELQKYKYLCCRARGFKNSPCKEDAAVHDGSSDDGHGVAFVLDAILSHAGVTDGHVHALIHH